MTSRVVPGAALAAATLCAHGPALAQYSDLAASVVITSLGVAYAFGPASSSSPPPTAIRVGDGDGVRDEIAAIEK